jgi:NADH dehydrogenase
MAPVAIQMGVHAGKTVIAREQGKAGPAFHYFDKGSMATIGRNAAVAHAFGLKLSGMIAWIAWLGLHLYYLIGLRDRLVVLLNWAYDYVLFERQIRLITQELDACRVPKLDGQPVQTSALPTPNRPAAEDGRAAAFTVPVAR